MKEHFLLFFSNEEAAVDFRKMYKLNKPPQSLRRTHTHTHTHTLESFGFELFETSESSSTLRG